MIEQIALHDPPGKRISLYRVQVEPLDYYLLVSWIEDVEFVTCEFDCEIDARRAFDAKRKFSVERTAV